MFDEVSFKLLGPDLENHLNLANLSLKRNIEKLANTLKLSLMLFSKIQKKNI